MHFCAQVLICILLSTPFPIFILLQDKLTPLHTFDCTCLMDERHESSERDCSRTPRSNADVLRYMSSIAINGWGEPRLSHGAMPFQEALQRSNDS